LGSGSVQLFTGQGPVRVLAHLLVSDSGSVWFLAKPGFWFGSFLPSSGSIPSLVISYYRLLTITLFRVTNQMDPHSAAAGYGRPLPPCRKLPWRRFAFWRVFF